ncbi:MAG: molecular chaperone DnaJ [Maricaulaceae bacterium]|jgi:molecular chaperone DnaJ
MSTKRDYYEVLGVPRDADEKALKSAYRKLAMQHHPDRNAGCTDAEAKFKEVNEAYAVLSDAQKRAAYDRFGHAGVQGQSGMGAGGDFHDFEDLVRGAFGGSFDDIFGELFGHGRARRGPRGGPQRGDDLRYDLEIELEDAFSGKEVEIKAPSAETCGTCTGSGAEPGTAVETCPTCQGAGAVRTSQGFFTMQRTCPSCGGQGRYVPTPCKVCDGAGRVRATRKLSVKIPAGVEDGMRIRLAGEGDAGPRGGPRGDLYIFVSIRPHDLFERDGADLYCHTPVSMVCAALSGEIEIPTIEGGRVKVKIPEGSQTGKKVRLRNKGMSSLRSPSRGDMIVELFVETPTKLNPRQRELLEEFCSESPEGCNPQHHGFLKRAKRFWDDISGGDDSRPNAH